MFEFVLFVITGWEVSLEGFVMLALFTSLVVCCAEVLELAGDVLLT